MQPSTLETEDTRLASNSGHELNINQKSIAMGLQAHIYKTKEKPESPTNFRSPWWEPVPVEELDKFDYDEMQEWNDDGKCIYLDHIIKDRPFRERLEDDVEVHFFDREWTLQRYLEQIYKEKGGPGDEFGDFNYCSLELNLDDLKRIIEDFSQESMPYFGHTNKPRRDRRTKAEILTAARKSRDAINDGFHVYYIGCY